MITIEECDSIPESFDTLFDQTLPLMDAGTFDWNFLNNPTDKKAAIKEEYEKFILAPNYKIIEWKSNGTPIQLSAAALHYETSDHVLFVYALYGNDASGSKNWLYDTSYLETTRLFFKDTLKVAGYELSLIKDSSIYNHHTSKSWSSDYYNRSIIEDSDTPESVVTVRYTLK